MSQQDFRRIFLENILSFLWRQWSALGVLGEARSEDPWVIDPESLLIFTLEIGRYEPRLFDEVMDWLVVNGHWIDVQRLRGILRSRDKWSRRLMGAATSWLAKESSERKWKNVARFCSTGAKTINRKQAESFFLEKNGQPYPTLKEADPVFLSCGFFREPLNLRRLTREVPITSHLTIRFFLRALFGVGSRAECLLYLLTRDGGHPAEVAKAIGLSIRGTQDILIDLSRSGLVLTRIKGKRKIEYWLSQERWWEFLSKGSITEIRKPVWIDWIALFSALSCVWSALTEVSKQDLSDYMRSSKLRDAMELVSAEFSRSGLDIPTFPGENVMPKEYESAVEAFIVHVFGAK